MPTAGERIDEVLRDPAASEALKGALRQFWDRDVVDAANDAGLLASILDQRAHEAQDMRATHALLQFDAPVTVKVDLECRTVTEVVVHDSAAKNLVCVEHDAGPEKGGTIINEHSGDLERQVVRAAIATAEKEPWPAWGIAE